MNGLYYIAFILGFTSVAVSQFDKVQNDFITYKSEVRQIATATPTASCQRTLSANFCDFTK
jgi:hypothetical protein